MATKIEIGQTLPSEVNAPVEIPHIPENIKKEVTSSVIEPKALVIDGQTLVKPSDSATLQSQQPSLEYLKNIKLSSPNNSLFGFVHFLIRAAKKLAFIAKEKLTGKKLVTEYSPE